MYTEKNTGTNLPAQIEIYATPGQEYNFMFIAKGGGSANKTFLFQQTKALLNPDKLMQFVDEKIKVILECQQNNSKGGSHNCLGRNVWQSPIGKQAVPH